MCYFVSRMRVPIAAAVLLAISCGGRNASDPSAEWVRVLERKKAAVHPAATAGQKQAYADSVAAFIDANPHHSRAMEVYRHIQLEFARELAAHGRHRDAIRFYRAVLQNDPGNQEAAAGVATAIDHLAVSRHKLLALQKGMSQREVAAVLGKPIPGWTVRSRRRDSTVESWYYRNLDGGIAGVYFRDGELLAAEENSEARQVPLARAFD